MKIVSVVGTLVFSAGLVSGCTSAKDQPKPQQQTQSQKNSSNTDGLENDVPKRRVHKDDKGIIGKTTNEIVDLQKALKENPKLIMITKNRIAGSDPLTQSMSAYLSLASRVRMLAFKHDLDIARNFGDGSPLSYDDVVKRMKKYDIELTMLYAWQKYAYDSKKGDIVILEDAELKAKILDD